MTLVDLRRPDIVAHGEETFKNVYHTKLFSDVTLVTEENQYIEAHKLILSSNSPFFEAIFTKQTHHNLLIYLHGISHRTLNSVLEFIYLSKTKVIASELDRFMEVSIQLQIKGISEKSETELQPKDTGIADYQLFKEEQTSNIDEFQTTNSKECTLHEVISEAFDEEKERIESASFDTEILDKNPDKCKEVQGKRNITEEIQQISTFEHDRQKLADFGCLGKKETIIGVEQLIESKNSKHVERTDISPSKIYTQMYKCKICGYKSKSKIQSSSKRNLREHMKSCHNCPYCDYVAESNPNLKNHKKIKHKVLNL